MIHQWKRFGKQIQKEGNLSGNISTPSWSIHWTRRAGIVSRPPREPGMPLWKTHRGCEEADLKGWLPACESLALQNGDEVDLQDEETSSTLHLARALILANTRSEYFFVPSPQQIAQSGKTDLKYTEIGGNLFIVFGSDTKDDCIYPGAQNILSPSAAPSFLPHRHN